MCFNVQLLKLIIKLQSLFNKILSCLTILVNHHPHIPARIQRITQPRHIFRCSKLTQTGHIIILRVGKPILESVDVLVIALRAFHLRMQNLQDGFQFLDLFVSGVAFALFGIFPTAYS